MRGVWIRVRQVDSLYDAGNVLFAATCDTLAPMAAPTDIQRRKLVKEIESAFQTYGKLYGSRVHVGALTDTDEANRKLILDCGAEFKRILQGETEWVDAAEFTEDLFSLTDRGCPKLDIIDLMFRSTTGRNLSVFDDLADVGLSDAILLQLRVACAWCGDQIALLNMPQMLGPLSFLPETVPEIAGEERTQLIADLQKLPDLLHIYSSLLKMYPPEKVQKYEDAGWGRDSLLGFFYVIIYMFKCGYPTLSRLLRAMRYVRYSVSPRSRYVHRFGRVRVARDQRRDPLGELALQQRLFRFFKANRGFFSFAYRHIFFHLSTATSHLRARGETCLTTLQYVHTKLPNWPPTPTQNPDSKA